MSSYYDEEEEYDIRIHSGRRAPSPVYAERRRPARPVYYSHGSGGYLVPENTIARVHRSSSTGHRPSPPPQAPVIITNNYFDEDAIDDGHGRYLTRPSRPRSRSRSRTSRTSSVASSHNDYELERTRRELEKYKLEAQKEKEREHMKKEMEWKALKAEKQAKEEAARIKKEAEEAVEKFKVEEAKKAAKEKKEKEEREEEYKHRLEDDLRKSGMDERQIAVVLKKEQAVDPNRPTYTRMSRRHLSIETLNRYRIDYEFDVDPEYLLIKRWVPEFEQDFLWTHTREIRERRPSHHHHQPEQVVLAIEGKKKRHEEPTFEFVRKKERRPSPSPLLTFLAGGKR